MSTMRFNFRSQVLGYYADVTVILPTDDISYYDLRQGNPEGVRSFGPVDKPVYKPGMKFQTVYLMHGGADDDSLVYRYTNVERYAQSNMVMVVIPNMVHGFGAHACYGRDYSLFITDELPAVVQSMFPSSTKREDNFIVGYAMGGNAALGNAIFAPQNYEYCVDISGGIGYTLDTENMVSDLKRVHSKNGFPIYASTFGLPENFAGSKNDLYPVITKHIADGTKLPKFVLMCGSDEHIRPRVEKDVAKLVELGVDHDYIIMEGYTHDWPMWDDSLCKAFGEVLPLKRKPIYPED